MIKRVVGFFQMLFFLAAVGLVGYNTWEINRLRAEAISLRQQLAEARAAKKHSAVVLPVPEGASAGIPFAPQWLNDAQKHAERAQAFLRNKQYGEAKTEMDQAIALAQTNGQNAQKESRAALRQLQKTADAVSSVSAQAASLLGNDTGHDAGQKKP